MKDTRIVLDNVRMRIPGDAKLVVAYIDKNGVLRLAQANCSQADVKEIGNTIFAAA